MNSVIVFVPRVIDEHEFIGIFEGVPEVVEVSGGVASTSEGARLYIAEATDIGDEYSADEFRLLAEELGEWRAFIVHYNTYELAARLVSAIAGNWESVVDTDHGEILTARELSARFELDPTWDWRVAAEAPRPANSDDGRPQPR